jgi:hypothetical protein
VTRSGEIWARAERLRAQCKTRSEEIKVSGSPALRGCETIAEARQPRHKRQQRTARRAAAQQQRSSAAIDASRGIRDGKMGSMRAWHSRQKLGTRVCSGGTSAAAQQPTPAVA